MGPDDIEKEEREREREEMDNINLRFGEQKIYYYDNEGQQHTRIVEVDDGA